MENQTQDLPIWALWAVGFAGAVTRICLLRENGKQLSYYGMTATLISGTICAGFGSGMVAQWVPGMGAISLGISAYVAGIFGMVFAEYIVTLGFPKKEGN